MFKVNYRIVDEFDKLKSMDFGFFDTDYKHITGFIEIRFGEKKEGCYYHENPIQEGETGGELLDWWLNYLLDVCNYLLTIEYAAFNEPEKVNRWLEFKLIGNNVIINTAIDMQKNSSKRFITEVNADFNYFEPLDFSVKYDKFKDEIVGVVNQFLNELEALNPNLLKTKMALELLSKIKP